MKILTRKKAGHQPQSKIQKRIAGWSTSELQIWAENSLAAIGKGVAGSGALTVERMTDVNKDAEVLYEITQELLRRVKNAG
jgi:hypothetical protein